MRKFAVVLLVIFAMSLNSAMCEQTKSNVVYQKEYALSTDNDKGTLKFIGSMLGRDLNEGNVYNIKYDLKNKITYMQGKNGCEYFVTYNDDGSFEIKTVEKTSASDIQTKVYKYNNRNQKTSQTVLEKSEATNYKIERFSDYGQGNQADNFIKKETTDYSAGAAVIASGKKGSFDYLKNLLGKNDWLSLHSGDYTLKYDDRGRVSELYYNKGGNAGGAAPQITKYRVIYNDDTTTIIGFGSSKQYDFSRTFRDNGKEIK